jgi:SAM-dependent methyltransferase
VAAKPRNPWLSIPLADYEAHMALPDVGQAELLAEVLARAVREQAPRSVAIFGCAGGNGFERVPSDTRLVGVDVNPDYVAAARARHRRRKRLELYVADVTTDELPFAPVELAFAGLLFEYVDLATALTRIGEKLVPGGALVAAVQLPSRRAKVTPSPYTSLAQLKSGMRLVSTAELLQAATAQRYELRAADIWTAGGGKEFAVHLYRLD